MGIPARPPGKPKRRAGPHGAPMQLEKDMKTFVKSLAAAGILGFAAPAALLGLTAPAAAMGAKCGPSGQSIRILASDFPAIHAVVDEAEKNCAAAASEFTRNHTTKAREIMNAALTPNPSEYSSVIVANSTLVQLMNDNLVRPLDGFVAKYGGDLKKNQLITVNGKVMAVAFMANSQHLFVREDILRKAGVRGIPATYEEVLDAAEAIRAAGIMRHPLVINMQVGWNLGEVFNMIFLGHGGAFFEPGTAKPSINNAKGVATLELMKKLAEYAHPDHLAQASNETQAVWEAGQAALGIMWGSRGSAVLDNEGSSPEVVSNTTLAGAPTVAGGSIPASTLWWDGVTIARNVSDKEAEAAFAALVGAMNRQMVAANNDDAVWLLDGFRPGPAAAGVSATAQGGAKPYPMQPQIGLMHTALGAEIADFIKGGESARQALADAEAAYVTAAREAGYLK